MYSVESSAGMRAASGRRRPAWDRWPDTFWLGRWSLSLQPPPLPLSPSRPSRTCVRVGPPATGSGPTRPAGLAVAGRRPSYPSRIRVERAVTRTAAGAAPGQVCAAGPSWHHQPKPRPRIWALMWEHMRYGTSENRAGAAVRCVYCVACVPGT